MVVGSEGYRGRYMYPKTMVCVVLLMYRSNVAEALGRFVCTSKCYYAEYSLRFCQCTCFSIVQTCADRNNLGLWFRSPRCSQLHRLLLRDDLAQHLVDQIRTAA
jgi:hypothetical protein